MKNTQRKNILIWFSKDGFHFYMEGGTNILFYPFSPDSVMYFDIFDEQNFLSSLEAFLKANAIQDVTAYLIIDQSAVIENYFVKNNEKVLSDFIENIPYENVISKVSEKGDSMHAIGFNGAFYQNLNSVLEKHNGTIMAVLPYILIPETKLDIQSAPLILKKATSLITESMITETDNSTPINTYDNNNQYTPANSPSKDRSTLPYLIPVFFILIGILVYLLMTQL